MTCSFYCTKKGSTVLYTFNFGTKTFNIGHRWCHGSQDWSYDRFVDSSKGVFWKGVRKLSYDSSPVICFRKTCQGYASKRVLKVRKYKKWKILLWIGQCRCWFCPLVCPSVCPVRIFFRSISSWISEILVSYTAKNICYPQIVSL